MFTEYDLPHILIVWECRMLIITYNEMYKTIQAKAFPKSPACMCFNGTGNEDILYSYVTISYFVPRVFRNNVHNAHTTQSTVLRDFHFQMIQITHNFFLLFITTSHPSIPMCQSLTFPPNQLRFSFCNSERSKNQLIVTSWFCVCNFIGMNNNVIKLSVNILQPILTNDN